MEFRIHASIRARGQAPFDDREFRSEDYDTFDDFAAAVYEFVMVNLDDYLEGDDDDEND